MRRILFMLTAIAIVGVLYAETKVDPSLLSAVTDANSTGRVELPATAVPPAPLDEFRFIGMNSCALSHCHGGDRGVTGAEYALWIRDPHASAFDTLRSERSMAIAQNLNMSEVPHQSQKCLVCHSVTLPSHQSQSVKLLSEGVSCEACHGGAEKWVSLHTTPNWATLSTDDKAAVGYLDTKSSSGRASICTKCHVGSRDAIVDHDLIAAGHPAMQFELSAFHDQLPKHWNDTANSPSKVELWMAGQAQLASSQLSQIDCLPNELKNLEFSNYECYTCHKSLYDPTVDTSSDAFRQEVRQLNWGGWTSKLMTALADNSSHVEARQAQAITDLSQSIRLTNQRPPSHQTLQSGISELQNWSDSMANRQFSQDDLRQLLRIIATLDEADSPRWNDCWQRYLGLRAVYLTMMQSDSNTSSTMRDRTLEELLDQLREKLDFPPGYNSPVNFDPVAVSEILTRLQRHLERN